MTGPLTRSTIVVVTWRGKGHVSACLDAVAAQTRPHRLLVIDNASDDGTAEVLARHPSAPPVQRLPTNIGYAGALAKAKVDTEFTAWLNDDAEPAPDWLAHLEDALDQHKEAAAAASHMIGLDGSVISTGVALTADGHGVDLTAEHIPPFGFCGGAVLLRTEALRQAGGVPAHFFCYYEDTDTAWRLRLKGHTIVSAPKAKVTHRHGASTRPGSRQFHLWNERNRLAMLIRCAPATVAIREAARFTAITALLPLRRLLGTFRPARDTEPPGPEAARPEPLALPTTATTRPEPLPPSATETTKPEAPPPPSTEAMKPKPLPLHHAMPQSWPQETPTDQETVDNPPLAVQNCRWLRVAWKSGAPRVHGWDFRSGWVGELVRGCRMWARKCRRLPVASKPGDPPAHGWDFRSGSVGELVASGRSRLRNCRSSLVAWVRGPEANADVIPWNFRVGLRLQVMGELAVTLRSLLRERRTVTRLADVPRSVVWRRARSMNSPG